MIYYLLFIILPRESFDPGTLSANKNRDEAREMSDPKDKPRKVSTCFEDPTWAEMIEKASGEGKLGSLSEEMMRSLVKGLGPKTGQGQTEDQDRDTGGPK